MLTDEVGYVKTGLVVGLGPLLFFGIDKSGVYNLGCIPWGCERCGTTDHRSLYILIQERGQDQYDFSSLPLSSAHVFVLWTKGLPSKM